MVLLVDPWAVCDDLPTDNLVIECVNSEERSTIGVSKGVVNDNSAMNIHNMYTVYTAV